MSEVKESKDVNQHLLNIITPMGIDYDTTFCNVGENTGKVFAVVKYPSEGADYGWLADIANLEGSSTTIEYRPTDASKLIDVYNQKIGNLKGDRDLVKQESERQKIEQQIADLEEMIRRISIVNEPVGYINTMVHVQDTNPNTLANRIKRVSSICAVAGCNIRNLKYKQFPALKSISPYGMPDKAVSNIGDRNVPISTFLGGFPMAASGINDKGGYYLGKAKNNKIVILNEWMRNKDRVNSNWFISGLPGVGKSTALKDIFVKEYAFFGTKIILFDPEKEYQDLARHQNINGDIIDCAGGSTGRINPLQIRVSPRVTQEDLKADEIMDDYFEYTEENGLSDMALHIQNLRVFFKLYFGEKDFDAGIKTALEECLIDTYQTFGIEWDTDVSKMSPEQFPIMEHLYDSVEKRANLKGLSDYKKSIYDHLKDLLFSAARGSDRYIWNGHTTINPKSRFIVLDTSKLLDLDDNVKRAQFFNLTMWSWQQMAADRTEKVLFGIDEGYLFVDPDYPDLIKFIRNISKRDRKYEGGLMFITHSVVDLLDPAVKRFGQAIIDNSCYKFIMGCDGKNL